jgi:TonB family protein
LAKIFLFYFVLAFGMFTADTSPTQTVAQSSATSNPGGNSQIPVESPPPLPTRANERPGNIEILTDTQGVDFGPYLARVKHDVQQAWYSGIPESAVLLKGLVTIEFAILRDGTVKGMRMVASSGRVSLDRAAWAGVATGGPFPPLPAEFKGQYLALRFRFYYNSTPGDLAGPEPAPVSSNFPAPGPIPEPGFTTASGVTVAAPPTSFNAPGPKASILHALLMAQSESMAPKYPERALSSRLEGKVRLVVNVRADGMVEDISVPQGNPILAEASVKAVKKWRFYPALKDGQHVADVVQMNVYFKLDGNNVRVEVVPPEAATESLVH